MKSLTPVATRIQTITPSLGPGSSQNAVCALATMLGRRLASLVLFLCAALLAQPCVATPFQWEYTGSLNVGRAAHTATLLANGKVLVAAGVGDAAVDTAELYDPTTVNWTFTGSLNEARWNHTAILLSDGRVLVAAGQDPYYPAPDIASAELYDPATGIWTLTSSLNNARSYHTATLLPDGRVLVAGGAYWDGGIYHAIASAELYDPATGTWTYTGSLNTARSSHTATLLPDGRVLVAGGGYYSLASAELYDPATGTWTYTGSLNSGRRGHTATLFSDGKVLVAGGSNYDYPSLASAELYDPPNGTWTLTGSLNTARSGHAATLLSDGRVLVAGGGGDLASAELYDPATGTWTLTGSLNTARSAPATLLPDGEVLVAGGWGGWLASAELYEPGIGPPPSPTPTATPTPTPTPTPTTKVDGRGALDNQGNEVTFNFSASQSNEGGTLGYLSFCDPTAGVCITNARIWSLSFAGNTADFSGRDDASRVRFRVSATDNGDPGASDTISISLSTGYFVSGTLTSGNIRIY